MSAGAAAAPAGLPRTAMVLAAGLGTRLRPITDQLPKPLVEIGGRPLLDHAIDRLAAAGVERVVVNVHYKGEMIVRHLAARLRPRIEISVEDELLETGGGIVKALPLLDETFFVVNADVFWLDGKVPALTRLARAWASASTEGVAIDGLLLLQRTTRGVGYDGPGDFLLDEVGVPRRRGQREIAPFLFAGVQLIHRRLLDGETVRKFSLNPVWDRAIRNDRLRAIVHDGEWYHIGTPQGLAATEERLASHRIER
jgi:MurNAc alpha-1-phosphate uridylyltransferase